MFSHNVRKFHEHPWHQPVTPSKCLSTTQSFSSQNFWMTIFHHVHRSIHWRSTHETFTFLKPWIPFFSHGQLTQASSLFLQYIAHGTSYATYTFPRTFFYSRLSYKNFSPPPRFSGPFSSPRFFCKAGRAVYHHHHSSTGPFTKLLVFPQPSVNNHLLTHSSTSQLSIIVLDHVTTFLQ